MGKSTLSGNLSVGLALEGRRVIIIDTDKQQTCMKWGSRRKLTSAKPEVAFASLFVEGGNNHQFVETIKSLEGSGNFDDCIIDAGGRDNPELRLAMFVADILIAPTLPSQPDIESLEEFNDVVGEVMLGNPALRVITVVTKAATGLNFPREIALAREAIGKMKYLSKPEATIAERPTIRAYWQDGLSVYDVDKDSARKAVSEFDQIKQQL